MQMEIFPKFRAVISIYKGDGSMRIQVIDIEKLAIPEGYTYIRCDQYAPERFIKIYTDDDGIVSPHCMEYMKNNVKRVYDTSDIIAIREMAKEHEVGSLMHCYGRNTTKAYHYDHDGWRD